jgi:murein DD-endopeptidase MepM/ murein hydrolase activator NlpD
VLIEHNSNGRIWWSGYLHMAGIAVSLGQQVTTGTVIGYIGRAGADNDHLHFVTYNGTNTWGGLRSYDAHLTVR